MRASGSGCYCCNTVFTDEHFGNPNKVKVMKKSKYLNLAAWDFVPGKNPIGELATVHIPANVIVWIAHSASGRLDIGLDGSIVHLLQRDSNKNKATKTELARSLFYNIGPTYWIEDDIDALYQELDEELNLDFMVKTKIKNPKDQETAKDLTEI